MSSDVFELSAEQREVTGKRVKNLRNDGFIPATLYEKGKESTNLKIAYMPLVKAYSAVGKSQPVDIVYDGKKHLTMIKDVHMDPVKNTIMHVAFHAVDKNKPVEADIPVHLEGDAPGVIAGNFITRPNDTVTVSARPSDLPEVLNVSIESLEDPGDSVTVANIASVPNVTFLSEPETILAVLEEPRVVEEEPEKEVDAADVPSEHGGEDKKGSESSNEEPASE